MGGDVVMSATEGRTVIGIGGVAVSRGSAGVIITHALGTCLGVAVHDRVAGVGGMIHLQLPCAARSPDRAKELPSLFVDLGLTQLIERALALGADKRRLNLKVAGGANVTGAPDGPFNIAQANIVMLRKTCWKLGLLIAAEDLGGSSPRTMSLDLASGETSIQSLGQVRSL